MASRGLLPILGMSIPRPVRGWFWRAESVLAAPLAWRIAVAALIALQLALVVTHEPWLDEWQALQIALQSPTLAHLLDNLRYEGHPPLWYLILRGLAPLLPTFWILPAAQAAIALGIQSLILIRAPFTRLERLLLASSFFILFEYGVVSRSLSLGVLLLFTIFAARRKALVWLAVILLPMVDFLFGVLSLAALLLLWKDGRWSWPGAAIWAASSLSAAASVIPAADMLPAVYVDHFMEGPRILLENLSALLVPLQTVDNRIQWKGGLPFGLWVVAGPAFILFSLRQTRTDPLQGRLYLGFLLVTLAFSLLVYPLAIRHLSLLAVFMILLKWREAGRGSPPGGAFRLWLAAASACGLLVAAINLARPFDTAPAAAAYIRAHDLQDEHWVSWHESRGQGVAALLGREFHSLGKGCTQSFIRWNFRDGISTYPELRRALGKVADEYGRFYLLTELPLPSGDEGFIRPLAQISAGYDGQRYNLFLVAPDRPPSTRRPPPCPPERRPLGSVRPLWAD